MKTNQIADAWTSFAEQLVKEECPKANVNCSEFGQLMAKVVAKYGAAESVLWAEKVPVGTEDRTWVRAWLCRKGVPKYSTIVLPSDPDHAHALRCLHSFESVLK